MTIIMLLPLLFIILVFITSFLFATRNSKPANRRMVRVFSFVAIYIFFLTSGFIINRVLTQKQNNSNAFIYSQPTTQPSHNHASATVTTGSTTIHANASTNSASITKTVGPPPAWQPAIDDNFPADIYPSTTAAANYLATKILDYATTLPPSDYEHGILLATDTLDRAHKKVIDVLSVSLTKLTPVTLGVYKKNRNIPQLVIKIDCTLQDSTQKTTWNPVQNQHQINILASIIKNDKILSTHSLEVIDKPWVDQFSSFNSTNNNNTWLLARSQQLTSTTDEAHQSAINRASYKLVPIIRYNLAKLSSNHAPALRNLTDQQLATLIIPHLQHSDLITDTFTQRLTRPYGQIYRQALLIDSTPEQIHTLANHLIKAQHATARQYQVKNTVRYASWFSIAAMAALIFIVYLFLNAATRGYYTIAMRIAAIVITATIATAILFAIR